jgi:hypothetical protein
MRCRGTLMPSTPGLKRARIEHIGDVVGIICTERAVATAT